MHSSVTETKMGMWSTFSQLTRSHFTKSTIHLPPEAQTVWLTFGTDQRYLHTSRTDKTRKDCVNSTNTTLRYPASVFPTMEAHWQLPAHTCTRTNIHQKKFLKMQFIFVVFQTRKLNQNKRNDIPKKAVTFAAKIESQESHEIRALQFRRKSVQLCGLTLKMRFSFKFSEP